ncbi:MAG TPA: NADH-quinone oxidoreductase subunit J [Polyangiaceae bacterium]|jgi:NADH-quinone oxidoreductase subunit J|nr:NADH-quinone oxidoreductase subunit J [Polyangiaceae bacterium]
MSSGTVLFILCSIACIVGAIAVVVSRNPVRSAVGLLTTIVGIAGLFLKLSAQFLAAIQLIVYAGAVVVLFVFVLMLLGADAHAVREDRARGAKIVSGVLLGLMALGAMVALYPHADQVTRFGPVSPDHGSVESVGRLLFTAGIVPFELATALLIVAVVGAIAVARGRHSPGKHAPPIKDPRKLFIGPLLPRDDSGRPKEVAP